MEPSKAYKKKKRRKTIVTIAVFVAALAVIGSIVGPGLPPEGMTKVLPHAQYELVKEAGASQWPFTVPEVWLVCYQDGAMAYQNKSWYHINGTGSSVLARHGITDAQDIREILKPNPQYPGAVQTAYNGKPLADYTLGLCK
jgi:hypothetical protein